jgi:hypothetical protein
MERKQFFTIFPSYTNDATGIVSSSTAFLKVLVIVYFPLAGFPISTSFEKDQKQPRLLLVSVDVLEGAAVTFDSYPKVDGTRKSKYGEYVKLDSGNDNNNSDTEYTIYYNDDIKSEHAIASGSVPINYDYAKIEADRLTIDNQGNRKIEKVQRYFLGWWYSN